MGRKKWGKEYVDLRGRWQDNSKLVRQIIGDAKCGKDWASRLRPFLVSDSNANVPRGHVYSVAPDLRQICFDEKDISGCNFAFASLAGATGYRCTGDGVVCENSICAHSKWRRASLVRASFDGAKGYRAYFAEADLREASFRRCNLRDASFRAADLRGSRFCDSDLRFANLSNIQCEGADFSGAKVYGASLWQVRYDNIRCERLDISPEGDGSILTSTLRLAPLISMLTQVPHLAEVIAALKLNTVVILGPDSTPEHRATLGTIEAAIVKRGLVPVIIRKQAEIPGEPFFKKAMMYSLLAHYVVVENSHPSGHLMELGRLLPAGCVVAVLQQEGRGATLLVEEEQGLYPNHLKRFRYPAGGLAKVVSDACLWCERQTQTLARTYCDLYAAADAEVEDRCR